MPFALCSKNAIKASSTFDLMGLAAFLLSESEARKVSKFRAIFAIRLNCVFAPFCN